MLGEQIRVMPLCWSDQQATDVEKAWSDLWLFPFALWTNMEGMFRSLQKWQVVVKRILLSLITVRSFLLGFVSLSTRTGIIKDTCKVQNLWQHYLTAAQGTVGIWTWWLHWEWKEQCALAGSEFTESWKKPSGLLILQWGWTTALNRLEGGKRRIFWGLEWHSGSCRHGYPWAFWCWHARLVMYKVTSIAWIRLPGFLCKLFWSSKINNPFRKG